MEDNRIEDIVENVVSTEEEPKEIVEDAEKEIAEDEDITEDTIEESIEEESTSEESAEESSAEEENNEDTKLDATIEPIQDMQNYVAANPSMVNYTESDEIQEEVKRPFFSIIIPCYNSNPENIKELFASIYNAGCNDDLEIIVANDRSTELEFLNIINGYNKNINSEYVIPAPYRFNIKVVDVPEQLDDGTKVIHCPGNTKEVGALNATGKWITFIDHDDIFCENAFEIIKNAIETSGEQYMVNSNFKEYDPVNNRPLQDMIHSYNWMHGKFYNLDNFWRAFNFHFPFNLDSHEDIAISSKVHCEIYKLKKEQDFWIEDFTYVWRAWPNSTSRVYYNKEVNKNITYLEFYFYDYIAATLGVYMNRFNELKAQNSVTEDDILFYVHMYADVILYLYFYIQGFKFGRPIKDFDFEKEFVVKHYIKTFYNTFGVDPVFLYNMVTENYAAWYNSVRESAAIGVGNFVETDSFFDFISK